MPIVFVKVIGLLKNISDKSVKRIAEVLKIAPTYPGFTDRSKASSVATITPIILKTPIAIQKTCNRFIYIC